MATKDLKINIAGDGDLTVSNFDLGFTASTAEWLQQKLYIKFKTFLGELWLNTSLGVPYHEAILVKNPDLLFIASLLKTQILEEDYIDSLISFKITNFDSLTRTINFIWEAQMITGDIIGDTV